jgi:hypothetical protein
MICIREFPDATHRSKTTGSLPNPQAPACYARKTSRKGASMKSITLALVLATTLVCGSVSDAQTVSAEDSLKATHELLMQAVTTANVAMVGNIVHPQAFGFFRQSMRLAELKPGVTITDILTPILADLSAFKLTRYDTIVRAMGDTGIVTLATIAESSKKSDRYLRSTYVYIRTEGNWKLLTWHTSDAPVKK